MYLIVSILDFTKHGKMVNKKMCSFSPVMETDLNK